MSERSNREKRGIAFVKKSGKVLELKVESELAKQVANWKLGIELTVEKSMQKTNTNKDEFAFLIEDLNLNITKDDYKEMIKTVDGKPIYMAWYLNNKTFTKEQFNTLVAISKTNNFSLITDYVQEQVENVFYDTFERIVDDGVEVDLDDIDTTYMLSRIRAFLAVFRDMLAELKKK